MDTTFLHQIWVVLSKEIKYVLRSKKTFLFTVLIPLLLIPSLLSLLSYSIENVTNQVSNEIDITINDTDNYLYDYLSNLSDVQIIETQDIENDLKSGKSLANIIIPSNFNEMLSSGQNPEVMIETCQSSLKSQIAISKIIEHLSAYNTSYVQAYLIQEGISPQILEPIHFNISNISEERENVDTTVNFILPMLVLLYCFAGSVSTATDLSAGEKEKYTLEPLLSTKTSRSAIVIGKLLATSFVAIISGLSSIIGIIGFIKLFPQQYNAYFSIQQIFIILAIVILSSIFFASINLSVGIYARNYKEAQTYLTPITFILLIPSYLSYGIDINDITMQYVSIPFLNMICVLKEVLSGIFITNHIIILMAWIILYILLTSILSVKLFKREKVVFRM